jgi:hypothetical protein
MENTENTENTENIDTVKINIIEKKPENITIIDDNVKIADEIKKKPRKQLTQESKDKRATALIKARNAKKEKKEETIKERVKNKEKKKEIIEKMENILIKEPDKIQKENKEEKEKKKMELIDELVKNKLYEYKELKKIYKNKLVKNYF